MSVTLCNRINWSNTTNEHILPKRIHIDFRMTYSHNTDDHSWTGLLTEIRLLNINMLVM